MSTPTNIWHVSAPWKVLDQAAKQLNPDGILVVAAPNPKAWQATVLRGRWPHHDLPRHLFALPIPWLKAFAAKIGLKPELVTTRDTGSLFWNSFTWAMVFRDLGKTPKHKHRLWKYGMRFARLVSGLEGKEGRGAAYTAIFRK